MVMVNGVEGFEAWRLRERAALREAVAQLRAVILDDDVTTRLAKVQTVPLRVTVREAGRILAWHK